VIVSVENLTHRYGDRVALSNVSFNTNQGEIFGLLGPNGAGKSTLFRILSTLMAPTEGKASIRGHDVKRDSAAVRRNIGVVFQSQSLDKKLTVEGKAAHSGFPQNGINAAELAFAATQALQDWFYKSYPPHPKEYAYGFLVPSSLKPTRVVSPSWPDRRECSRTKPIG
jgi:ABC-type Na+ transport system ATPase subunit NatA